MKSWPSPVNCFQYLEVDCCGTWRFHFNYCGQTKRRKGTGSQLWHQHSCFNDGRLGAFRTATGKAQTPAAIVSSSQVSQELAQDSLSPDTRYPESISFWKPSQVPQPLDNPPTLGRQRPRKVPHGIWQWAEEFGGHLGRPAWRSKPPFINMKKPWKM